MMEIRAFWSSKKTRCPGTVFEPGFPGTRVFDPSSHQPPSANLAWLQFSFRVSQLFRSFQADTANVRQSKILLEINNRAREDSVKRWGLRATAVWSPYLRRPDIGHPGCCRGTDMVRTQLTALKSNNPDLL